MSKGKKVPFEVVRPHADEIVRMLSGRNERAELCGSCRRKEKLVGDIDVIVSCPTSSESVVSMVSGMGYHIELSKDDGNPSRGSRLGHKLYIDELEESLCLDVWTVPREIFGSALIYTTGSLLFNIVLRRWAKHNGMVFKFSGAFDRSGQMADCSSEESCFKALGVDFVAPEDRSDIEKSMCKYLDIMEK